jgi:pimeloyl-ACP methyl ester carboxylesterase
MAMRVEADDIKIGNVTVKVRRAGKGPPVLFLHGAGGYTQWLPFFNALTENFEVIVPEHPGYGASDDPDFIRNVPDMAMFYLEFIETLGLDDIHLIGHSLGGWIAAELLIRDRSRFQSLTLIAPAGIRVKGILSGDGFIWNSEESVRNLFHDQAYAEILLALKPSEQQLDALLKNRFTSAKLGWQPRWYNPDLEKWLHRIKLPSLVVWGDDDKVMPTAYAALWQERLPDARLFIVKECGHLPHVEQGEIVTPEVQKFLRGVAR